MILDLKSLWGSTALRNQILTILQDSIGGQIDQNNGCRGMDYCRVFVLAMPLCGAEL